MDLGPDPHGLACMVLLALQVPYILQGLQVSPEGSFAAVQLQDQDQILQGGSPFLS